MPRLDKQTISSFLRSGCQRRLRLDLSPDTTRFRGERSSLNMPPRSPARPGLAALAQAGRDWEDAKINDLVATFGIHRLVGSPSRRQDGTHGFDETNLRAALDRSSPGDFVVQPQFALGDTAKAALGAADLGDLYDLEYSELRPDLVRVLAPGSVREEARPDGRSAPIAHGDSRVPLQVIDIKLTAEASVPYFVEGAYYLIALAGWLEDHGLADRYFVVPSPTVWPGSHDASAVRSLQGERQQAGTTPSEQELNAALTQDLEVEDLPVYAARLRRFFDVDLREALATPWENLPWHVDNRCVGCDYLGYPWPGASTDPRHCWPLAQATQQLSRVAFVSRGARTALEDENIPTVDQLAMRPPQDPAYDLHQTLRATREVVAERARSLTTGQAVIPARAGTSAVMPAWADLRIYLTADFDIGSGITIAFGFRAIWGVPTSRVPAPDNFHVFGSTVFPIDRRSISDEERELLNLLSEIDSALNHARTLDQNATVQVYIWDSVTYDHLTRVIGRHLPAIMANRALGRLAWLFPPEDVIPNPDIADEHGPITVIRDVVRSTVAAPVPHYYSLLNVAREYHSARTRPPYDQFSVNSLFEDPLSDQIPSERAHEIWSRSGPPRPWAAQLRSLDGTVKTKVSALQSIADRIGEDLRGTLNRTAPRIAQLRAPSLPQAMADDARLWFIYTQLNVALQRLDTERVLAMPPYEREARFRSALLYRRLQGSEETSELSRLGIAPAQGLAVYELATGSTEFKAREGDFTFAISPIADPGFLSRSLRRVAGAAPLPIPPGRSEWTRMRWVMGVSIRAIDRDQRRIVLELDPRWLATVQALEAQGLVDLSREVALDPVHRDFLVNRLRTTLNAIGNPPIAASAPAVAAALGRRRRAAASAATPVSELLWDAGAMADRTVDRGDLNPVRAMLRTDRFDLNASQWNAWEAALTRRLALVWGPPGTGKSQTLRAVVLGALHAPAPESRSKRVLITGPTYQAIDNLFVSLSAATSGGGPLAVDQGLFRRLRSTAAAPSADVPPDMDCPRGSPAWAAVVNRLRTSGGITVVGATPQQVHNLLIDAGGPISELFDLIVMDEASQVDVPSAALALSGLATNGAVVIAGDPRQLPPIHEADPPLGLESMVGPIFTYLEQRFGLAPSVLETNYRSNSDIVAFSHEAGYPRSLEAYSPDLRLHLLSPLPDTTDEPPSWPSSLLWNREFCEILDPDQPVSCFVYEEGKSSQWNRFEAQVIAGLTWLLRERLSDQPQHERIPPGGEVRPAGTEAYAPADFWSKGIGIITPHRAQQALVTTALQQVFPAEAIFIRGAVDTVERFQGQQRDVILASFALGDPDAIGDEDEFLLSLNRFNVMASRPRAKLVVLVSREVVDHLSSDTEVLRGSALLKNYAELFCARAESVELRYQDVNGAPASHTGVHRWFDPSSD